MFDYQNKIESELIITKLRKQSEKINNRLDNIRRYSLEEKNETKITDEKEVII